MKQIESTDIRQFLESVSLAGKDEKKKRLYSYIYKLASKPKRQRLSVNLSKLELHAKDGDNIVVPGKVLGVGKITKKINISAVRYSSDALVKLKASKCTIVPIREMVAKEGVRIII